MVGDSPKLQFLQWQAVGNLSTILAGINSLTALTTITKMNTTTVPTQTALNATYIGSRLNGTVVNGPVVDVVIPRMDGNITATVNGTGVSNTTIVLNTFVSMSSSFEFMAMPLTTNVTSSGNATSSNVTSTPTPNATSTPSPSPTPSSNATITSNATSTNATSTNTTSGGATSGRVMVMGDFALKSNEVDKVLAVLAAGTSVLQGVNISVTAIHNHMLMETPKITFVHFEAMGDLNQIITVINTALAQTTIRGNTTSTATGSNTTSTSNATTATR
jgi:hypothetical protein